MTNKQSWAKDTLEEWIKVFDLDLEDSKRMATLIDIIVKRVRIEEKEKYDKLLTSKSEQMEREIQVRVMNEDNPQYVLGWNACRYLCLELLKK
jgi:hypothetical protein